MSEVRRGKTTGLYDKTRTRITWSTTSYPKMELTEKDTETVAFPDGGGRLIVEITPYPSIGVAQVVTMTPDQSEAIDRYSRKQSQVLAELHKTDLLLDITLVPLDNWKDEILLRVPRGSAIFPVLDVRTVSLEQVKHCLSH